MRNNSLGSSSYSEYMMQNKNNANLSGDKKRRQEIINVVSRKKEEEISEHNNRIIQKAQEDREREEALFGLRLQQQSFELQMRMFENTRARMRNTFIEIENNLDQMIESSPMRDTFLRSRVENLKNDLEIQYQQSLKEPLEDVSLRTDVSSPIPAFDNVQSTASFITDRDALITELSKNLTDDGIYNPPVAWQESLNVNILDGARDIVSGIKKFPESYQGWDYFMAIDLPGAVQKKAQELANNFFDPESENTFTSYSGKQNVKINGKYYDRNTVTSFLYGELIDRTFNVLYRNNDGFGDYLSYKETGKTLEERFLEEYNKIRADLVQSRDMAGENAYSSVSNAAQYGFTNINTQAANRDAARGYYDDLIDQLDNWKEQTLASGFKAGFSLPNFLSFGIYGLLTDFYKINVLNKLGNGEPLDGYEAELARLIEFEQSINSMGKEMYGELRTWSSIGQGLGTTVEIAPQFLVGMSATSGIGAGVKYGTKTMAKKFIRNKTWNNATRLARTFAWDATKFSGVAYARGFVGAPFMPSTYRGYTNEYVSQFEFDGNGNFKFKPKNQATMIAGAWIDGANEIASEYYGGVFDDVISLGSKAFGRATGISKVLNRSEAGTWIRRVSQTPMSAATKKMLRNAGYTGIFSEPLSEVFGDFMSQTMRMMVGADYSFDHFKNADYWLTTMGVSTLYGGALTTVSSGTNIIREANNARQLLKARKEFLDAIKNEDLKNTVRLLGNSDNYVNASIELANLDWENYKPEDIASAINYIRYSHVFQTTMGDIEGQEQMNAFENTMSNLYKREYTLGEKHTGRIISAVDKNTNLYSILSGNLQDPNAIFTVINEEGQVLEMPASELTIIDLDTIENIMTSEYHNMFSSESESARLNSVRYNFESIANPTSKDVERVLTEYSIKKPSVGSKVTLVTGEEATVIEDLENGMYKVNTYDSADGTFKDIEIPFYRIKSDNPITAAAQEKVYKDTITAYEKGDFSEVQKINKSPEEKLDDIINDDYNSRLFNDKGVVKLDEQQIINNFSLEDPASLEDYINKVGNKVSPQVRQSLNNALKLSKIHNEINHQLSHLVQTSKNRTDVAILSNVLSKEIITSDPNITSEKLLETIINNRNYNSKIKHDFKNILKALTNAKVQRRTTTKTETSVTQKDVKGKRGRKQIEKGIKDLRKALKDNNPIEALNAINWIDDTLNKVEDKPITTKEKQFVEETRKTLKEQGYEIQPMRGMPYHEGIRANAQFRLNPELPAGTQIIKEVRKPQINKDGVRVQAAEVTVEQGPEIEKETPDISQAVTKEMTEEEPIDFSESTDNAVEPKKEDSVTQETEEPIIIPELEEFFAVPDSDKLIETPSREEEIETLTEDQRSQVRIHNENGTDLVDYISDSALPDDQSTDEVIVDKHELQGNRIYRYNGEQLRNNQAQVKRTPNKEGDNHDLVYKWLDENSIDLQGIIDNELAAIAALDTDVRFMMMTEGTKSGYTVGSPILNTVFQVVEYTDAIKKIHNEKRGGVITSNGKEYLLIGITGFSTSKPGIFNPEVAHYNFIADKVLKTARNNYTSQTNEISREAYYVHPTMSTKIKNIEAGWIVTQTTEDSEKQSRSLGELLTDETRNPHGITAENSKWLIPTRNSAKPIKVRVGTTDVVHGLKIPTGLAGSLFLLVPAANGHYIPISVKIQTTNELVDGTLKDTIWETAQNLLSTEKETRDYAIKELCKLLNLTKEGYNIFIDDSEIDFDNPNSAKIVFTQNGRRMATEIPLSSPNASGTLYKALFTNIPFQLNIGLQTLVSGELQAYIDAGALITDAALLGTTNASYTVHSIGLDLKADPYTENSTESQEGSYENSDLRRTQDNGIINYGNNNYFRMAEDQYVNIKTDEPVTDVKTIREIKTHVWLEKSKPTPAKIEQGSKAKLYIVGENEVISVSKKGIITFYSMERSREIINEINRENIEESRINNAVEELARIEEQQQAEQVMPQELQEEEDASVPEVTFTESFDAFNTSEISPVENSFTEVSFEETSNPKEEVSATFTEGIVENTDITQLDTPTLLREIKAQLKEEGINAKDIKIIMNEAYNQLQEMGLGSYYSKDQESTIKTIIDNIKNCH